MPSISVITLQIAQAQAHAPAQSVDRDMASIHVIALPTVQVQVQVKALALAVVSLHVTLLLVAKQVAVVLRMCFKTAMRLALKPVHTLVQIRQMVASTIPPTPVSDKCIKNIRENWALSP